MDERKVDIRVYLVRDFMFFGVQTDLVAHTAPKNLNGNNPIVVVLVPYKMVIIPSSYTI